MANSIDYLLSNTKTTSSSKNKYGQYFTPDIIAEFMINLADINSSSQILEPSCGEGIFIQQLQKKGYSNIIGYEIDPSLIDFGCNQNIRNESFVTANIPSNFDLIIGNPPYIRWKNLEKELKQELSTNLLWNKHFNSLCDYSSIFILKSIELLKEGGQLIFITPEYWLNTTHSQNLRNYILKNGFFEEIYHFNETPIFEKVTVSTIIFKFIKSTKTKPTISLTKYQANKKLNKEILTHLKQKKKIDFAQNFTISQFQQNKRWLLSPAKVRNEMLLFENKCKANAFQSLDLFNNNTSYTTIKDVCTIGNGLVSGLDKAFQLKEENLNNKEKKFSLKVVKAKQIQPFYHNSFTNYIFINDIKDEKIVQSDFPNFFRQLQPYKQKLEKRYQYNKEIPYWHWVFLRNFKLFSSQQERILVPCKERISNKDYFRFAYAKNHLFPTQDVTAIFKKEQTKESLFYILAFLNNKRVFQWLTNNGIVKGNIVEFSERPIASIPFREIDWSNPIEKNIHDTIVIHTQKYITTQANPLLEQINLLFNKLFD